MVRFQPPLKGASFIDLDFSIPFISIPVRKTIDSFDTLDFPTININPASLALGGAVVLGTTVLAPLFLQSYTAYAGPRYSRSKFKFLIHYTILSLVELNYYSCLATEQSE
ncbi:hypothetical protein K1T71_010661 [Dendrolimus kikuchii]|uniref:Uncharacterized protein n=1 Tax=Dendrolimus kikuchii TaxID=765133 RepID=A0ACC1CPV4_9NEOP|nr:hypothetical protein K1T71_010661 [Dendrolimus kikuchii]